MPRRSPASLTKQLEDALRGFLLYPRRCRGCSNHPQSEKWKKYKSNVMRILVLMLQVINGPSSTHPPGRKKASTQPRSTSLLQTTRGAPNRSTVCLPPFLLSSTTQTALIHTGKANFGQIDHRVLLHVRRRPVHVCDGAEQLCCSRASSTTCIAPCVSGYDPSMTQAQPSLRRRCARRPVNARRVAVTRKATANAPSAADKSRGILDRP